MVGIALLKPVQSVPALPRKPAAPNSTCGQVYNSPIKPFIHKDLGPALDSPILFQNPVGGGHAHGYRAEILEHIIDAILDAERAGVLPERYSDIAARMHILNRGLRRVGIIGLVDEATGYQEIRAQRALATILEKYIARELQPWTKTFPYEFYELIYRLRGWNGPHGHRRTPLIGRYTNDFVYERLAPGVLNQLKKLNPTLPSGRRRTTHHQWFTPDLGHPKLKEHLAAVMALMRAAPNWEAFKRSLNRAFPKLNKTLDLPFDEEGDDE